MIPVLLSINPYINFKFIWIFGGCYWYLLTSGCEGRNSIVRNDFFYFFFIFYFLCEYNFELFSWENDSLVNWRAELYILYRKVKVKMTVIAFNYTRVGKLLGGSTGYAIP